MKFYDPVDNEQNSSSCKSRNLNLVTQKGKGSKALRSDGSPIVANGSKGDTSVSKNVVYDNDAACLMFLTSDDEHNVSATQLTCMQMVLFGSMSLIPCCHCFLVVLFTKLWSLLIAAMHYIQD